MTHRRSLKVLLLGFFVLLASASVAFGEVDAELLKRAKAGDADAQFNLGVMCAKGQGVAQDSAEAVKWYRKSAEQGFAKAQLMLGFWYAAGKGVAKDDVEAVKWFRKAAEQGLAEAKYHLGMMYTFSKGVPEDYVLAHMWLNLARAQGYEKAKKALDLMVPQMTKEQITEAQKMAREWQAKH